jgi:hypothetical protein
MICINVCNISYRGIRRIVFKDRNSLIELFWYYIVIMEDHEVLRPIQIDCRLKVPFKGDRLKSTRREVRIILSKNTGCIRVRETLENPSHPREHIRVSAGADWVHGQQAARIR